MVGDTASSRGIYFYWGLNYAHMRPLFFTILFSLITFIAFKLSLLCRVERVLESISPTTFMSCICLYSFKISATDCFPNISIPFFECIWLYLVISAVYWKIPSASTLWNYIVLFCSVYSPRFINWVTYGMPPNLILSLSIFPEFSCVVLRTPVPLLHLYLYIPIWALLFVLTSTTWFFWLLPLLILITVYLPSWPCYHHMRPVSFCCQYLWFHVLYLHNRLRRFLCLSCYHRKYQCRYLCHLWCVHILSCSSILYAWTYVYGDHWESLSSFSAMSWKSSSSSIVVPRIHSKIGYSLVITCWSSSSDNSSTQ